MLSSARSNKSRPGIKIRLVDNNIGVKTGEMITVNDNLKMSPRFSEKEIKFDEYSSSVVLKKDGHCYKPSKVEGQIDIMIDPLVKEPISKEDQHFFNEMEHDSIRYDGLDIILDGLFKDKYTQDLHLLVMDTVVLKDGVAQYLVYNLPKGRRKLKFETKRHKLLLPILSTFFKKRREMMVVDEAKKADDEKEAEEQERANSRAMKSFASPNSSYISITTNRSDRAGSFNLENIYINKFDRMFERSRKRKKAMEWKAKSKYLFDRLYKNLPRNELTAKQSGNLISDFAYYRHSEDSNFKILSENDFLRMMRQRQNLKLWRKVMHLTAIFREKGKTLKIYRLKFDIRQYLEHTQFKKAKKYIQSIADNYKKEEVQQDLQYIKDLVALSPTEYCIYQVSKMIWFFEIFRKRTINKIMVDFVKTAKNDYYIMNIRNIQHSRAKPENLERYEVRRLLYRDEAYKNSHLRQVAYFKVGDPAYYSRNVAKKQKQLDEIYERIKDEINLTMKVEEKTDPRPDHAFKVFHPDFTVGLTDIIEGRADADSASKALKKLYYKDYRKKGPLKPLRQEEVQKEREKALRNHQNYQRRHSKLWLYKKGLPSLGEQIYQSPFDLGQGLKRAKSLALLKGSDYRRKTERKTRLKRMLLNNFMAMECKKIGENEPTLGFSDLRLSSMEESSFPTAIPFRPGSGNSLLRKSQSSNKMTRFKLS